MKRSVNVSRLRSRLLRELALRLSGWALALVRWSEICLRSSLRG